MPGPNRKGRFWEASDWEWRLATDSVEEVGDCQSLTLERNRLQASRWDDRRLDRDEFRELAQVRGGTHLLRHLVLLDASDRAGSSRMLSNRVRIHRGRGGRTSDRPD